MSNVTVIGSGISGAVCASLLAQNGISVTMFDVGRGPGGRMSQRREMAEDGRDLLFDHGAPYFTVNNPEVLALVREWESKGTIALWDEKFRSFDFNTKKFLNTEEEEVSNQKYVGIPGMNYICQALSSQPGVTARFGQGVAKAEWSESEDLWSLTGTKVENQFRKYYFKHQPMSDFQMAANMVVFEQACDFCFWHATQLPGIYLRTVERGRNHLPLIRGISRGARLHSQKIEPKLQGSSEALREYSFAFLDDFSEMEFDKVHGYIDMEIHASKSVERKNMGELLALYCGKKV